jgi:hypothetical protein
MLLIEVFRDLSGSEQRSVVYEPNIKVETFSKALLKVEREDKTVPVLPKE